MDGSPHGIVDVLIAVTTVVEAQEAATRIEDVHRLLPEVWRQNDPGMLAGTTVT